MAYRTTDGHEFPTRQRAEMYQRSLIVDKGKQDIANAPGGSSWENDRRAHGQPRSVYQEYDGPGRWRVTAKFADGYTHTSVHPESFRAHQVSAHLLGHDEPPPGIRTQQRARAHPSGPKEEERLRVEDHREEDEE